MNIEQERKDFEAWLTSHCDYDDLNKSEIELARDAWQAGRAALQSQGKYSFDDMGIGIISVDGRSLKTQNIPRPPGFNNNSEWYGYAKVICSLLNEGNNDAMQESLDKSQDRERIDWIDEVGYADITRFSSNEWQVVIGELFGTGYTLRDAIDATIDHARRIEGRGK